jgi:hypothetical protein
MPTGAPPTINAAAPSGTIQTLPFWNLAGVTDTGALGVQGVVGGVPQTLGYSLINTTSVLTRPANTTAYGTTGNIFIASTTTAGSVVVPSVTAARIAAGAFMLRRCRLLTNKTSGWNGAILQINFWSTAPTYTTGDAGVWTVATGAAAWLGQMNVTLQQYGDGAIGAGVPGVGAELGIDLASGQAMFWDLFIVSTAALTPASGQTFTLIPEIYQVS